MGRLDLGKAVPDAAGFALGGLLLGFDDVEGRGHARCQGRRHACRIPPTTTPMITRGITRLLPQRWSLHQTLITQMYGDALSEGVVWAQLCTLASSALSVNHWPPPVRQRVTMTGTCSKSHAHQIAQISVSL